VGDRTLDDTLFHGGPPARLWLWLRLRSAPEPVLGSALIAALAAWLPLAALSAARGDFFGPPGTELFLRDIAVHARYLIAVPLLIAAQPGCIASLGIFARHFLDSGLVGASDLEGFHRAVASTRRLRDSAAVEVVIIIIGYLAVAVALYSVPPSVLPAWAAGTGATHLSPAGWWHALVSAPLLVILLLGWLWRLWLWGRFLWLMSQLDLKLLAAHADGAGGLRFVGYAVSAHAPLAIALSVMVAGGVANRIVHDGAALLSFKYLVLGVTGLVVALIVAPLFVFLGRGLTAWQRGVVEYGALADHVGHDFERNWVGRPSGVVQNPLLAGALAATVNVSTLTAKVYAMRFIPIDSRSVIALIVMTLLPYLPVVLITVPLSVVLKDLAKFII
jgi:hypothetical protein